jgi:NADP-reducing hydrogenase subunit HndD
VDTIRILINGHPLRIREDATILEASREVKYASRQFDIKIPSLYYLKNVQQADCSGLSVVEVKGMDGLINASTVKVVEGMEIYTKTPAVIEAQKAALDRILDIHDLDCKNCLRTGKCELQLLQWQFRMTKDPRYAKIKTDPIDESGIVVRDSNKCVRCSRCIAACTDIQGIGAIKMEGEGLAGKVVPATGMSLNDTKCVNCGQCIAACPVGALHERDDTDKIFEVIADPGKFVVIQAAPSVRASIGEYFGYPIGSETEGKMAAALRALGFDRVFDTEFGADLTIMEEATEFIDRVKNGGVLPMTTSCCPAWVKYCEQEFSEFLSNISSCKSPHQMCGAIVKSYLAGKEGIARENIVVVSAMPCTAKKFELTRDNEAGAGVPDVDFAITARELGRMIKRAEIPFLALPNEEFDSPLGLGSGAGTIFGATGGVMEAALRTAADWMAGESIAEIAYEDVRGIEGVKEAAYTIAGKEVKVAVVSGLANAKALMEKIAAGEAQYSFIEVMACPGGCVNGGGQPQQLADIRTVVDIRSKRAGALYGIDEKANIRKAHDNPEIKGLYRSYLGEPGGEKAHKLLHTAYVKR